MQRRFKTANESVISLAGEFPKCKGLYPDCPEEPSLMDSMCRTCPKTEGLKKPKPSEIEEETKQKLKKQILKILLLVMTLIMSLMLLLMMILMMILMMKNTNKTPLLMKLMLNQKLMLTLTMR